MVSLAVQRLLSQRPQKDARILLIGAGQTNHLVGKLLVKHGFQHFTVFNRSMEGSEQLAKKVGGRAFRLDELPYYREGFDIMVVCTGATEPIVTPPLFEVLLNSETAPKQVVDLSIPNNVHPDVASRTGLHYTEVEDLRALARENLAFRQQEVECATEMLREQLDAFAHHFRSRQLEVALRDVPVQIKAIRERAINEVFSDEVNALAPETRDLVERMMTYMERKCIGVPMKVAKESLLK